MDQTSGYDADEFPVIVELLSVTGPAPTPPGYDATAGRLTEPPELSRFTSRSSRTTLPVSASIAPVGPNALPLTWNARCLMVVPGLVIQRGEPAARITGRSPARSPCRYTWPGVNVL